MEEQQVDVSIDEVKEMAKLLMDMGKQMGYSPKKFIVIASIATGHLREALGIGELVMKDKTKGE